MVTVNSITERDCIWAVDATATTELKAGSQYFKTAPVVTKAGLLHLGYKSL